MIRIFLFSTLAAFCLQDSKQTTSHFGGYVIPPLGLNSTSTSAKVPENIEVCLTPRYKHDLASPEASKITNLSSNVFSGLSKELKATAVEFINKGDYVRIDLVNPKVSYLDNREVDGTTNPKLFQRNQAPVRSVHRAANPRVSHRTAVTTLCVHLHLLPQLPILLHASEEKEHIEVREEIRRA